MSADASHSPLEKFVARATKLYSLPKVAMEVLDLTNCPQVDATQLKACIERDPALVGKILQTVNSSLFGGARNITDLNQAVAMLGIKPLKLLVLGFSLPPKLLSGIETTALERYWKSTLIKAIAARDLSPRYENIDADDAFLAGLLQDIGMLALLKELGEPYAQFLRQAQTENVDLVILELETLGFDHRLLSARLLQSWGLPEMLWRTIAASTSIEQLPRSGSPLGEGVSVLATADGVARLLTQHQPAALVAVMEREGENDVGWWTEFAAGLQQQVEQMADVFDLKSSQTENYDEVVRRAHAQLAYVAEDAAAELASGSREVKTTSFNLEQAAAAFGDAALQAFERAEVSEEPEAAQPVALREDSGLLGALASSVASCRRRRQPLSLALLDIDEYEEIVFNSGGAAAGICGELRAQLEHHLEAGQQVLVATDAQLALLLEGADRLEAVGTARRILDEARSGHLYASGGVAQTLTMSVGIASVALPAKNFPAADLHEAAKRCLFAVQSCGGDSVKSIDIY